MDPVAITAILAVILIFVAVFDLIEIRRGEHSSKNDNS